MKKLILVAVFALFSSASFAQYGCGPDATYFNNGCGEGCMAVAVRLTGILEVDIARINANGGKIVRRLTADELELLNEFCG